MGVLEFVESLIGHLAWPAVVLAVSLIFHRPLADLISRIKVAKVAGAEITFTEKWNAEAAAAIPGAIAPSAQTAPAPPVVEPSERGPVAAGPPSPRPGARPVPPGHSGRADGPRPEFIAQPPDRAVFEAYQRLTAALSSLVGLDGTEDTFTVGGFTTTVPRDAEALARTAGRRGLIPAETVESVRAISRLHQLAELRPEDVGPGQAREFVLLVNGVLNVVAKASAGAADAPRH